MKYWIISDTHHYHHKLHDKGFIGNPRKKDFDRQIFNNCLNTDPFDDILIHLGDVVFGNAIQTKKILKFYSETYKTVIFVKGNHDKFKQQKLYSNQIVLNSFNLQFFGWDITFQHQPPDFLIGFDYYMLDQKDIFIYGHIHEGNNRDKFKLINCLNFDIGEWGLSPVLLQHFIEKKIKKDV